MNINKIKFHTKQPGKYGEIVIFDFNGERWMKIGSEIEGRVYLSEENNFCEDLSPNNKKKANNNIPAASPIPASNYPYIGILPCLALNSLHDQHACIFGLGAGMMVSLLLNLFPKLKLTVIEVDNKIIKLCREYFADIKKFEAQKRLEIVCQSAESFLQRKSKNCLEKFSFFICDVYSGSELSGDCFKLFMQLANDYPTWANIIINNQVSTYKYLLSNLEKDLKMPLLSFPVEKQVGNNVSGSNWALTNQQYISPRAVDYIVFEKLFTVAAKKSREKFQQIITEIPARYFY